MKIEEIEKLLEGITPGEWKVNNTLLDGAIVRWHIAAPEHGSIYPICQHVIEEYPSGCEQLSNAQFISAAPQIIRDLIAQVSGARKAAFIEAAEMAKAWDCGNGDPSDAIAGNIANELRRKAEETGEVDTELWDNLLMRPESRKAEGKSES